jgi:hydrogenase maturation factor
VLKSSSGWAKIAQRRFSPDPWRCQVVDDVPQICHLLGAEGALALLDGELVVAQHLEHGANVLEVLRPCGAVDEDVVEENEDEAAQEAVQDLVHERL